MTTPELILASSSPYRKALLENLGLKPDAVSPGVSEEHLAEELPAARAARLGLAKARAVSGRLTGPGVVVGSDQVCHLDLEIYGKPGNHERAMAQLSDFSGKWVTFSTSIAMINDEGREVVDTEDYAVLFRELDESAIEQYLRLDQPYDCAGSIKAESLGISLIQDTRGRDINVLYGLPIMRFIELLPELQLDLFRFSFNR